VIVTMRNSLSLFFLNTFLSLKKRGELNGGEGGEVNKIVNDFSTGFPQDFHRLDRWVLR